MECLTRLDEIISSLLSDPPETISCDDVVWICTNAAAVLLSEPTLLEISGPVNICGDIHGQFSDLVHVFQAGGFGPSAKYLFLGDYVDRGEDGVEVVCLLLAMKLRFPTNVFLLRGNHESPDMTESFGFADECAQKLSSDILPVFFEAFDCLPIAALVDGRIFCVHGGLSPSLNSLSQIAEISRPVVIPDDGLLADLLWSDPSIDTLEWGPNPRGETFTWGVKVAEDFIMENNIQINNLAHQVAMSGYEFPFGCEHGVITVFTAPAYANAYDNQGAFVQVSEYGEVSFIVFGSADGTAQSQTCE
jgi:serine/threonine-protein phosphatase PP1 catalytic subunit